MYSEQLHTFVRELEAAAELSSESGFLERLFACLVESLSQRLNATCQPRGDILACSVSLLILSELAAEEEGESQSFSRSHYLLGLGFEYTSGGGRWQRHVKDGSSPGIDRDRIQRLALAFLHYLAGGFRVQALAVLRELKAFDLSGDVELYEVRAAVEAFHRGGLPDEGNTWARILAGTQVPTTSLERVLRGLGRTIRARVDTLLDDLGEAEPADWLAARNVDSSAEKFWAAYIALLRKRGITSFTPEQVGPGFAQWLVPDADLLVLLPTGSGKSVVGELCTALRMADGRGVAWLLPTRALVRQTKRFLMQAFANLEVTVQELPTTEDFEPLFADELEGGRVIAATTPERLSALARANPKALSELRLLVFDEAQLLTDEHRGIVAEQVLGEVRRLAPECRFVLMTAFAETRGVLLRMLRGLGREPVVLESDLRPTRRVYGALCAIPSGKGFESCAALFPPAEGRAARTRSAAIVHLGTTAKKSPGATRLARDFARRANAGGIRSVVFVAQKTSAESQTREIAKSCETMRELPPGVPERLALELGRPSQALTFADRGVAPHHAALTPLEQHVVESLVRSGHVRTVVATQTLAQGVNLPFDVSIVTFTSRYSESAKRRQDLPEAEIANMLGRAGRAGHVSDGICLVAQTEARQAIDALERSRRYFFGNRVPRDELGMGKLLARAERAHVERADWTATLDGISLGEAQLLTAFVLRATAGRQSSEASAAIRAELALYVSLGHVSQSVVDDYVRMLSSLALNFAEQIGGDAELLSCAMATGLPLEFLRGMLETVRGVAREALFESYAEAASWADAVVAAALEPCRARSWCEALGPYPSERMFRTIAAWRTGASIAELETELSDTALTTGKFLNQTLRQYSQLWSALVTVCEAADVGVALATTDYLRAVPAMTRDGVPSMDALLWLRALGGLDRVLAVRLSLNVGQAVDAKFGAKAAALQRWRRRSNERPQLGPLGDAALGAALGDEL